GGRGRAAGSAGAPWAWRGGRDRSGGYDGAAALPTLRRERTRPPLSSLLERHRHLLLGLEAEGLVLVERAERGLPVLLRLGHLEPRRQHGVVLHEVEERAAVEGHQIGRGHVCTPVT